MNTAGGGSKYDNEESFLFAEVMKYAYLIHAEGKFPAFPIIFLFSKKTLLMLGLGIDAPWQVQKGQKNAFVFNTEAHPVRVLHT